MIAGAYFLMQLAQRTERYKKEVMYAAEKESSIHMPDSQDTVQPTAIPTAMPTPTVLQQEFFSNIKIKIREDILQNLKLHGASKEVVKEELSVRELELLVKAENEQKTEKEKKPSKPKIKYFQEVELALYDHLGRKVSVEGTKKRGMLQIEFYGEEDLSELIKNLHLDT